MRLREISVFKSAVNGRKYDNVAEARTELENQIGVIIDKQPVRMPPNQALALLNLLIAERDNLVSILSSTVVSLGAGEVSIFDFKG